MVLNKVLPVNVRAIDPIENSLRIRQAVVGACDRCEQVLC